MANELELEDVRQQVRYMAQADSRFNKPNKSAAGYPSPTPYVSEIIAPSGEGEGWSAIVEAADGKCYKVGFTVGSSGKVSMGPNAVEVRRKTSYVANEASWVWSNEFKEVGEGDTLVQLAPFGRFPNVQGLQVFTPADAKSVASDFLANAKMAVGLGLPWYVGHPDHPLHKERYKDGAAYGRIKALEAKADPACPACQGFAANSTDAEPCREHGLFAKVKFNEKGKKAIANEEFHGHSVNWRLRKVGSEWHPFSLKSVGFTNQPNIPVPAITSANEAADEQASRRFSRLSSIRAASGVGAKAPSLSALAKLRK